MNAHNSMIEKWKNDPSFIKEYDNLEDDFALQKMTNLSYKSFKKDALQDTETQKAYDALAPVWNLRRQLIRLRTESQQAHLMDEGMSDKPNEHAARLLEIATEVRDFLVEFKDTCGKIKYFAALTPALDNIIIDWDDFVVDLTLSQSSELNDALTLLSDAI